MAPGSVSVFSDSNWAGCLDSRKSTSGACVVHGSHLVKAYSRTQSNIALSSREAESYALVAASSEALGVVAMTEDFGDEAEAYFYADASAAIGVANREGLGRIRHLGTQSLWLQHALRKKRVRLSKVPGKEQPVGHDDEACGSSRLRISAAIRELPNAIWTSRTCASNCELGGRVRSQ